MPDRHNELAVETEGIYLGMLRAMGCEERLKAAVALSESVRKMAIAGIRHDYPGITEDGLREELLRRLYG